MCLQLHWRARKPDNAKDSKVGLTNACELPRLVHLEMMNRGVYSAGRGMFALSTPMTDADIEKAVGSFRETIGMLKPYIADELPHLVAD